MSPNLSHTLAFLAALTRHRLAPHFGQQSPMPEIPVLEDDQHPFTRLVLDKSMTVDEFVVFATAVVPHLIPSFFDDIVGEFLQKGSDFLPIGGIKTSAVRTFLPTGETAVFLLAGADLERCIAVLHLFDEAHYFFREGILMLEEMRAGEPESAGRLILDTEWAERILFEKQKNRVLARPFPRNGSAPAWNGRIWYSMHKH